MTTQVPEFIGDDRSDFRTGDVGFLLKLTSKARGWVRWDLRSHPARTAGAFEPRLTGHVDGGQTDVEAVGVAEVYETARNGRAKVRLLAGTELTSALTALGYPELAP